MNRRLMGATLAVAAATLITSGKIALAKAQPAAAKVKCSGMNSCKGKGACKGKDNACAGKNGCKGKGWMMMDSEKDCMAKGGKEVKEEMKKK